MAPWCTRWWLGVLKMNSNQRGSLSIRSVWIQNWYIRLTACMVRIIQGGKPSSAIGIQNGKYVMGTHVWRSAVDRLKNCEQWWTTWLAQNTRTSWLIRWNQ